MKRLVCLSVIIIAIAFVLTACIEKFGKEEHPSIAEILEIGKEFLAEGQGSQAAEAFNAALKIEPNNVEAKYGVIISHTMQFFNLLNELLSTLSSMPSGSDTSGSTGQSPGMHEIPKIGDYLHGFLTDNVENNFSRNEKLYQDLVNYPDFTFNVPQYEIVLNGNVLFSFSGDFDKTDLHFFGVLSSLIYGISEFILAYDLNFDFKNISLDLTGSPDVVLDQIVSLLRNLLTDPRYPNFLLLLPDEGRAHMQTAGISLGMAFQRIGLIPEQLELESTSFTHGQIWYIDANNNGRYDIPDDPLTIPSIGSLDPDLIVQLKILSSEMATVFFDTSPLDPNPTSPDPLRLSYFNGLLMYLGVLSAPILPDWISIDIGPWFQNPADDGLRSLLFLVIDIYDAIVGPLFK